jgi:hypothetical protein
MAGRLAGQPQAVVANGRKATQSPLRLWTISMNKNTNRVLKVNVWTVKKPAAQIWGAWFLSKVCQD